MQTVPFLNYTEFLKKGLVKNGCFCPEWFDLQRARISNFYNAGESIEGALEMLTTFAQKQVNNKRYSGFPRVQRIEELFKQQKESRNV
ncbi:MAG: hypothetical protein MJK15_03875 [Colwellia sp.]|nr:hypothetical protein [Colwellia sp.]